MWVMYGVLLLVTCLGGVWAPLPDIPPPPGFDEGACIQHTPGVPVPVRADPIPNTPTKPIPVKPIPIKPQPRTTNLPSVALKQVIIPNHNIFDYSKLSNVQIHKLLDNAARKFRIDSLVTKTGKVRTLLDSINLGHGIIPGRVPSIDQLVQELQDLTVIAKVQQERHDNGTSSTRGYVPGRRRRREILLRRHTPFLARIPRRFKRVASAMLGHDWTHHFGGTLPDEFCACIKESELEDEYVPQDHAKFTCNPGRYCVCHVEGVT